jgi:hypothetical protein
MGSVGHNPLSGNQTSGGEYEDAWEDVFDAESLNQKQQQQRESRSSGYNSLTGHHHHNQPDMAAVVAPIVAPPVAPLHLPHNAANPLSHVLSKFHAIAASRYFDRTPHVQKGPGDLE